MQEYEEYLEDEFIIFNSELGVRDFVNIGEIDTANKKAWLDEPYEMVGPFCLDELCAKGVISFAACVVMCENYWHANRAFLQKESSLKQRKLQEELRKEINRKNRRKKLQGVYSQKQYRELLALPLEGKLESSQIKEAFKKIAKRAHPDVGGSHEKFIKITEARDYLLDI